VSTRLIARQYTHQMPNAIVAIVTGIPTRR
jgi:hypothetical protein